VEWDVAEHPGREVDIEAHISGLLRHEDPGTQALADLLLDRHTDSKLVEMPTSLFEALLAIARERQFKLFEVRGDGFSTTYRLQRPDPMGGS
jgi:hypothetical protein